MNMFRNFIGFLILMFSFNSYSWVSGNGMRVDKVMVHEEGVGRDYFVAFFKSESISFRCFIGNDETSMISLLLAMHMSKTSAQVHCHDADQEIGSYTAHKLHRIITNI